MSSRFKAGIGYMVVLFIALTSYAAAVGIDRTVSGGRERFLQGQVLAERCLDKGFCYLDEYDRDNAILLTSDRMVYRLRSNRVPGWKLDQAYGNQVFVKGVVRGNVLLVNDLVGGGKAKLSKACL